MGWQLIFKTHKRLKCSKMHLVSSPEICPSVERNYSGCESVNKAGAIDMAGYSFSSHFLPSLLDKSQVSIAVGPV